MIRWMFFSTLATAVLYGFYYLLLRRDRWLQLSRWFLMGALAFSLLYPILRLPDVGFPMLAVREWMTLKPVEVNAGAMQSSGLPHYAVEGEGIPGRLVATIYFFGLMTTLAFLIIQVTRQFALFCRIPSEKHDGIRLSLLEDDTPPCSFLNHVIIGRRGMSDEELRCVMTHEMEHVARRHSLDVLQMRLMCCASWFNPFAWLMLRELRAVHEYQADAAVNASHDNHQYLSLLFRQITGFVYGHITNNFQSINLKKRIEMMKRKKSRFGACKLLAVLPVAVFLMMIGCKSAQPATKGDSSVPKAGSAIDMAEVPPEFVGGVEALYRYLSENIHYPSQAKDKKIQGSVVVQFVVETDGSVTEAVVLRGIGVGCDEEALRVIKGMPKWKPGMNDGKPVRTHYTIPVTFKLR